MQRHKNIYCYLVNKKTLHTEADALGFKLIIREMEMSSRKRKSQETLKATVGFFICITL